MMSPCRQQAAAAAGKAAAAGLGQVVVVHQLVQTIDCSV
jgi:hypothetical protein